MEVAGERARQLCFETYGRAPSVRVTGDTAAHLPYVWGHLDYILFELFKNSMRAVVEQQMRDGVGVAAADGALPSVGVRICQAPEAITIHVADRGGGLAPEVRDSVWRYGFTTIGSGGGGAFQPPHASPHGGRLLRCSSLHLRQGHDRCSSRRSKLQSRRRNLI